MLGFGQALMGAGDFAPPAVGSVFVPTLYTGNAATRTITTSIDLTGAASGSLMQGGMVWIKGRSGATGHRLYDTGRGALNYLEPSDMTASTSLAASLTAFGSSGFNLGAESTVNASAATYVAWTFRKAKRFLDIVSYTGDGNTQQVIPHNLGSAPGMILVKNAGAATSWVAYHRGAGNTKFLILNTNVAAAASTSSWRNTDPTAAQFLIGTDVNSNTYPFVAYLFAHDAAADGIIQCGSYTGNGSTTGPTVTLGWEPQFIWIKGTTVTSSWVMMDTTRGVAAGGAGDALLFSNSTSADSSTDILTVTATGFQITSTTLHANTNLATYSYMAIRKP